MPAGGRPGNAARCATSADQRESLVLRWSCRRRVAIPLFAAMFLASPATSSGEQARKGKGYSPKEGGGSSGTATRSGDENRGSGGGDRTAGTNNRPADRR